MGLWEQVLAVRAYVFENPLNVVLLVALVYLAYNTLRTPLSEEVTPAVAAARQGLDASSAYSSLPLEHPASIEFLTYTPRTLALQDGTNTADAAESSKILLAINGNVFDVTSGRNFYGPGGPYGNFAGRDASRGMAKQSFDTGTSSSAQSRHAHAARPAFGHVGRPYRRRTVRFPTYAAKTWPNGSHTLQGSTGL